MRTQQVLLKSLDPSNLTALLPLQALSPQLILVFGDVTFFKQGTALSSFLSRAFPDAIRMGCSTAGEIIGSQIEEHSLIITALHFEHVKPHAVSATLNTMEDTYLAGQQLAQHLPAESKAVFVLAPGTNINGSALIKGIKNHLPDTTPLTGGLAGDGGDFSTTYTLFNNLVNDRQAVALGFEGEALRFYHGSFGGWQPFGPARKISRCDGNILYELDGEPAISVYKHYLGEHAKGLPATSLLFPFAILDEEHHETGLIRTILGIDETKCALILAGDVQENANLKLMHASTDRLVEGAQTAAEALMAMHKNSLSSDGLGLLVSCVGRKLVMGDRVEEELEAVASVLPKNTYLTGFYSYGEISPYHESVADCKLHNQTMTITYISET